MVAKFQAGQQAHSAVPLDSAERSVELINDLVESIVSEKRIQYRELSQVVLELKTERKAHALFSNISGGKLKRALSNIIDNAYEAINQRGKILVSLSIEGAHARIVVRDTGKGIPVDILPKLMQKGSTFGKEKGNGLGLYDAKKSIEAWSGEILLSSQEGLGTEVLISLPLVKEPDWFARKIVFDGETTIISVDDDVSIQETWRSRFTSVIENFENVQFLSFSSASEFVTWHKQARQNKYLFLIDYEFLHQELNGLDVIERLQIAQQSILVTSRYMDDGVSRRAQDLEVSILPKNLAGFIPFEIAAL